ncbi:MAG: sugar ABC transporter permease [Caldilineaceae bacterium]|nr:sugar ABC transporter permease [Caldilineaceae bacterium]
MAHHNQIHKRSQLALLLLPYAIGLCTLVLLPSLLSLGLAFTNYDALTPPVWSGLDNLRRLWGDRLFWVALTNSLLYLALAVPLRMGGAFLLGLLLARDGWGRGLLRGLAALPVAIPDVAYALVWLVTFNPRYGPLNLLLGSLSLPTPAWTIDPRTALWALVLMAAWQLGEVFVVLVASRRGLPDHLYDAAALDGAGAWGRFRHLTLPLMLPSLLLLTARDLIISLQANFVPSLLVTKGGPGYATLFLPLYSYQMAFDDLRLGYAAAVVWAMYGITLAVVAAQYLLTRRWAFGEALD